MSHLQSILRGLGQVMFQNNLYSGLLFLIGISYNSILLGAAVLLGTIFSTAIAYVLRYPKEDIQNGLYGFNGALVGIALWYFLGFSYTTLLALVVAAALTTPLAYYLKKIVTPFTAPFVVVAWIAIYSLLFVFNIPLLASSARADHTLDFLPALMNSFGQVFFQENSISGLIFVLAVVVNSKISAVYAIYAAVLGSLIGVLLGEPISAVNAGLLGYNAILCAIALADNKRSSLLWVSVATLLSVIVFIGFGKTGLIMLTAPFVLSTWMVLKFKKIKKTDLNDRHIAPLG